MSTSLIRIRRALISVSDKTGISNLANVLVKNDIEIVSTGGTATYLRKEGIKITDVSTVTDFPEMMDGRLKTLHPRIHGGLLSIRDNKKHLLDMEEHRIPEIDLLIVNLYPFEEAIKKNMNFSDILENIDIGGPAMIRAGAKNFKHVAVLVDIEDYEELEKELELKGGCTSLEFRTKLAEEAFSRTAEYDSIISRWMQNRSKTLFPRRVLIAGKLKKSLRYGENPHQSASYYQTNPNGDLLSASVIHQGKDLSYNNINDFNCAIEVLGEFEKEGEAVAVIIKHSNTCGVAVRDDLLSAYRAAYDCDRSSAFGGIVALNKRLDRETAAAITNIFTEIVIAPEADSGAIEVFSKKKNIRLITLEKTSVFKNEKMKFKQVLGGLLLQDKDVGRISYDDIKVVSKNKPTQLEIRDMLFAWKVVKHLKSNAIVFAKNMTTIGIGVGQMSRFDSTRIAKLKSKDLTKTLLLKTNVASGGVAASDAFFPFSDGILELVDAGVTAVIQPGGSIKDNEVIEAADDAGIAMIFTDTRHFNH